VDGRHAGVEEKGGQDRAVEVVDDLCASPVVSWRSACVKEVEGSDSRSSLPWSSCPRAAMRGLARRAACT